MIVNAVNHDCNNHDYNWLGYLTLIQLLMGYLMPKFDSFVNAVLQSWL